MKKTIVYSVFIIALLFSACSKSDSPPPPPPVDPCLGVTINPVAGITHTISGQALGTVTVTSPVGSGLMYRINGSPYQSSVNFSNLSAGSYTLTVRNADSCKGSLAVTINGYGPNFYNVQNDC